MTKKSSKYGRLYCQYPDYYYESIQINLIESGTYALSSISNIIMYGYLFEQHFNPYSISERLLSYNSANCPSNQFKIAIELQYNVTYILIVTTFFKDETGDFLILVSGPNNVTLNKISKYDV